VVANVNARLTPTSSDFQEFMTSSFFPPRIAWAKSHFQPGIFRLVGPIPEDILLGYLSGVRLATTHPTGYNFDDLGIGILANNVAGTHSAESLEFG
jgi:hypothetical protein